MISQGNSSGYFSDFLLRCYEYLDRLVDQSRLCYFCQADKALRAKFLLSDRPVRISKNKQLFFDITTLRLGDNKTGIQRVVRALLHAWQTDAPEGFDIQAVYGLYGKYHYAEGPFKDHYLTYQAGDIFLSADLNYETAFASAAFYQDLRHQGVKVFFIVHDILCVRMPHYFFDFAKERHERWLRIVCQQTGLICVSQTVAHEVATWRVNNHIEPHAALMWFHLGADIENSSPSLGMPTGINEHLKKFTAVPTFLMVGTLEPRKGHAQTLDAFERLWTAGLNLNLVIVGHAGWRMRKFIDRLRHHDEIEKQLYWFERASDELLDQLYQVSCCLIAASEGEGFGLPLVEAARRKIAIFARDIPIFHEVTQDHAFFFKGTSAEEMAESITTWLSLYQHHQHPRSDKIPYLSWKESARELWSKLNVMA